MAEEKTLWGKLKELGFTNKVTYPTKKQLFLNKFYRQPKYKAVTHTDWLVADLNGKHCECLMVDWWYVQLRIDGELVFDRHNRKFEDKEFLDLLPK